MDFVLRIDISSWFGWKSKIIIIKKKKKWEKFSRSENIDGANWRDATKGKTTFPPLPVKRKRGNKTGKSNDSSEGGR